MATQLQLRRGNTTQTNAFTGAIAEVTVDTDKKTLVIHDGSTAGGTPLAKEGVLSTVYTHANGAFDKANSANVLAQAAYNQANTATTSAQAAFDKANQTAQLAFTTVSANGTNLVADANNDTLTITSAVANGIFVTGVSGTDTLDIGLINSGVTASGYGDSISVPTFVVDAKGRLTSASNTTIRSGTTSQTGVVQLQDSVTSTSTSNAATPASVKTAYDFANTANTNAVNAGIYANAAFDKANSANSLAQQVFDYANTISGGAATDNVARTTSSAAFVQANAAFAQANSNYISAITRLDVTHSGSSAYLIDQYSGNNPAIYVTAGETIAFYLNVSGHPFMIRLSSGGANYDTGLIHVATDGTVSTGSSAQGKVTGTLYWKVPGELAGNTYVYQCSIHSGMVGNINIGQPNSIIFTHANAAFNSSNTKFSSSGGTITGDTTVTGNLTVVGQTIYANTTTALIADNVLTLNAAINQASAPTVNAGIEVDRGSSANVSLLWNETSDKWTFTNDGTTYYDIADAARLDSSFGHANSAFNQANTATTTAGLAYNHANGAFAQANTATTTGQAAFDKANTVATTAQNAYNLANGTAGVANTDYTTVSVTAGTYGNATYVPTVTLASNGRVTSVTTTAISAGASIGDVLALSIALG